MSSCAAASTASWSPGSFRIPDIYEGLLFHGVTADVWMRDGVTEQ